jgi:hypothetical protein
MGVAFVLVALGPDGWWLADATARRATAASAPDRLAVTH